MTAFLALIGILISLLGIAMLAGLGTTRKREEVAEPPGSVMHVACSAALVPGGLIMVLWALLG